jgi:oligopeptide transport system ATP-binding protein
MLGIKMSNKIIRVEGLKKYFPVEESLISSLFSKNRRFVHAVDGITFSINEGETFGLVGETGSGKTTTGRLILRSIEPTSGKIYFRDKNILELNKKELHLLRKEMQIIFQDPYASLNPRMRVVDIIGEPLEVFNLAKGPEKREMVMKLLKSVGLGSEDYLDRYPHEFSGGQRQRIGVARALAVNPKFIVADEPVSALDMSVRSEILNLMMDLKKDLGLTYLFIAHDLSVVKYISDRVGVMYLGKLMEEANCEDLFQNPLHPYTKALLGAIPVPDPLYKREKIKIIGEMPSPIEPPIGCRFHTRCPFNKEICEKNEPQFMDIGDGHFISCHLYN